MGGKSSNDTQSVSVDIPDFLRPFINQSTGTASLALGGLGQQLGGIEPGSNTASFQEPAPLGVPGMNFGGQSSTGPLFTIGPKGQRVPFVPQSQPQAPAGPAPELNIPDLASDFTPDQLAAFDVARQSAGQAGQATGPGGAFDQASNVLGQAAGGFGTGLEALQNTAQGDFLFGGQGFNEAVDAAVRAAQPQVASIFGGAGRGTGGLAQAAIGQSATDAFARQFGNERARQLSAAGTLADTGFRGALGLPALEQSRFGLDQGRFGLLNQIGGLQQQQAQNEIDAPIQGLQQLLAASGGTVNPNALLGQSTQVPGAGSLGQGLLGGAGGALAGAEAASMLGLSNPVGAGIFGGIGLLGGLLS